jgi:hypothetical protein
LRFVRSTEGRKAIAGILAGLIFFAMLFTVGLGFILYTLNSYNSYSRAQAAANQNQQAKSAEGLILMSCSSGYPLPSTGAPRRRCLSEDPSVWARDDGGTSVTLVGIYISENASGVINQIEPPSAPPSPQTTPPLPVTIEVGGSLLINTSEPAPPNGDTYTIDLISETGNTFSVVYPPVTVASSNEANSAPSSSGVGFLSFNFDTYTVYPVATGSGCSTLSYATNNNGAYPVNCVLETGSSGYTVNNPSGWSANACDSTSSNAGCYYAFSINASSTNPQGLSFSLDSNTYLQPNAICLTDDNCEDTATPTAFESGWEIGCINSDNVILPQSTCETNGSWTIPAYPNYVTIYFVYQLTQAPPTAIDTVGSWGCNSPGQTTCDSLSTTPVDLFFHGTEGANLYGENMPFATTLWTSAAAPTVTVTCTPGGAQPSIGVGGTSTCTATVTGASGSIDGETMGWGQNPNPGTVSFTPSSGTCALAGTTPSCSITVTGGSSGGLGIQALYPGDSNNAASEGSVDVIVETTALSATVSASPSMVSQGQTSTLTVAASGGSSPYSYAFYSVSSCNGTPLQSGSSDTYLASPTTTTIYCAEVTDSLGGTATNTVTVTVTLSDVTLGTFNHNPVKAGASESVTVSWVGGDAPYGVTLYETSTSPCSSASTLVATASGVTTSSYTFAFNAPASTGTYYYCAQVTDSIGESSPSSGTYSLTVTHDVTQIQMVAGTSSSGSSSFTCSFGSSVTLGDLLTVSFSYYASSLPSVSSVTDTRGSSFGPVVAGGVTTGSTASTVSFVYYASAAGTGADTIMVRLRAAPTVAFVTCSEWSGVVSVTPVSVNLNSGTNSSTTYGASVSSFTPYSGDLVYAYVGYTACESTSSIGYNNPPYTQGVANGADVSTGVQCYSSGGHGTSYNFVLNEASEHVLDWGGGSTSSTFSISQSQTPSGGHGGHGFGGGNTAGWAEIAVEFDPPPSGVPASSLGPSSRASGAEGFYAPTMNALVPLVALALESIASEEGGVKPIPGPRRQLKSTPPDFCFGYPYHPKSHMYCDHSET